MKMDTVLNNSKDTRIAMVAKLAAVGISVKPEVMHDFTPEEKARVQELIDEARREGLERMKFPCVRK